MLVLPHVGACRGDTRFCLLIVIRMCFNNYSTTLVLLGLVPTDHNGRAGSTAVRTIDILIGFNFVTSQPDDCCFRPIFLHNYIGLEATEVSDYRKELTFSLSSARQLAADLIKRAQSRYNGTYDTSSQDTDYWVGDWVLVQFPQEETGKQCTLSRPWHGPYHVVDKRDPDITVVKVYAPQDGQIQVHQTQVVHCPPELPAGFFQYDMLCWSRATAQVG